MVAPRAAVSKLQLLRPSTLKVLAEEVQRPGKLVQTIVDKEDALAAKTSPAAIDAMSAVAIEIQMFSKRHQLPVIL